MEAYFLVVVMDCFGYSLCASAGGISSWILIYNVSFCYQTATSMHECKSADVLNALNAVPGSAVVKWDLCPRAFGFCCSCASQPATESSRSDSSSRATSNCCHLKGNVISNPLSSLQTHSRILTFFTICLQRLAGH